MHFNFTIIGQATEVNGPDPDTPIPCRPTLQYRNGPLHPHTADLFSQREISCLSHRSRGTAWEISAWKGKSDTKQVSCLGVPKPYLNLPLQGCRTSSAGDLSPLCQSQGASEMNVTGVGACNLAGPRPLETSAYHCHDHATTVPGGLGGSLIDRRHPPLYYPIILSHRSHAKGPGSRRSHS